MHWYEKLSQYFPIEEMKSQAHIEALLCDHGDIYFKDESPDHVMMYVELDRFVFVDYLIVSKQARGRGLGRALLDRLKAKGKPILLEVEPLDYEDTDTVKRMRFYQREGFRHAEGVVYRRRSLATRKITPLEILYWTPDPSVTEADVYAHMRDTYRRIHTYRDVHFYGDAYQPVEEVLRLVEAQAA